MSPTDWTRWRKCPVCDAEAGRACIQLLAVHGDGRLTREELASPHRSRKPSTRKGGRDD